MLADGEIGYEKVTNKAKFGDGVTAWNSLAYFGTAGTGTVTSVTSANADATVATTTTTPVITIVRAPALRSATTTVNVSSATAPTAGQVLTATSSTAATWQTVTGTGTVTNVTGTTNRITVATGTTTPVVDIAATYVGQTSLTTLGTVTTGTWNATTIDTPKGGTNITSYTTGDILYASTTSILSKRGIGATGDVLTVAGGVPIWAPPTGGGSGVTFYNVLPANTTVAANTSYIVISDFNLNGFTLTVNGNFMVIG